MSFYILALWHCSAHLSEALKLKPFPSTSYLRSKKFYKKLNLIQRYCTIKISHTQACLIMHRNLQLIY